MGKYIESVSGYGANFDVSYYIQGCKNHYTDHNIEKLFAESDESLRNCEQCHNYSYDSRLGEMTCSKLTELRLTEMR